MTPTVTISYEEYNELLKFKESCNTKRVLLSVYDGKSQRRYHFDIDDKMMQEELGREYNKLTLEVGKLHEENRKLCFDMWVKDALLKELRNNAENKKWWQIWK